MAINEKLAGQEKKELETELEESKKLSKEEKARLIREEVGKAEYYDNIEMI
jgi:hypothetical protein